MCTANSSSSPELLTEAISTAHLTDAIFPEHLADGISPKPLTDAAHLSFLMWRGILPALTAVPVRGRTGRRQFLGHDDLGAAGASGDHVEFIHERAHQENTTSGSAQEVFFGQRIGDRGQVKAFAF